MDAVIEFVILEKDTDVFKTKCDAIMLPVNCSGILNDDISREFKIRFPKSYFTFASNCKSGKIQVGRLSCHNENGKMIILCPVKKLYKDSTNPDFIKSGLLDLKNVFGLFPWVKSVAIYPLSFSDELDLEQYKSILNETLENVSNKIEVYLFGRHDDVFLSLEELLFLGIRMNLSNPNDLKTIAFVMALACGLVKDDDFNITIRLFMEKVKAINLKIQNIYKQDASLHNSDVELYKRFCTPAIKQRLEKYRKVVKHCTTLINELEKIKNK